MKELCRNGINSSITGINYTINYNEIKGYLNSTLLFKDIFFFSKKVKQNKELSSNFAKKRVKKKKVYGFMIIVQENF